MTAKLEKTQTPGIFRRGSRYVVVWRHRGVQHKSFHRTLAEAREAKAERGRSGGQRQPASREPFDQFARSWIASYQGRTRRGFDDDTRASYAAALERAADFFGSRPVREIERADVKRYLGHLQKQGLEPSSISKYVAPLRAMFGDAVEDGHLVVNPATALRINQKTTSQTDEGQEARAKALTRGELAAVLSATPDQHRTLFELLASTGLRISEALGLNWDDIKFDPTPSVTVRRQCYRGTLKNHPKTDAGYRTLPLSPSMAGRLWEAGADATGPVFATRTGSRLSDRNLRRVLDTTARLAGLQPFGFHVFRHTCASMLIAEGRNIRQVAAWLGHADPSITLRTYSHLMDDGLGAGLDVGNDWATPHPQMPAITALSPTAKSADLREDHEQQQAPVNAARFS